MNVQDLLRFADAYMAAVGLSADSTLSYRMFGDTKKLTALRSGAGITVARFNSAIEWLTQNWPASVDRPDGLPSHNQEDAA